MAAPQPIDGIGYERELANRTRPMLPACRSGSDQECTWGSPSAPTRIVVVGDSVAMHYANALRELALNSGDQIQVHVEALGGCPFSDGPRSSPRIRSSSTELGPQGIRSRLHQREQTTVVLISNRYGGYRRVGIQHAMTPDDWFDSVRQMVDKVRASTTEDRVDGRTARGQEHQGLLRQPVKVPADCVSRVTNQCLSMAAIEQRLAEALGGVMGGFAPVVLQRMTACAPALWDRHRRNMTRCTRRGPFEEMIYPVMDESFRAAGFY